MTSATPIQKIEPSHFRWDAESGVAEGIRTVTAEASAADGRSPLNEAALLSLRHEGLTASSLWVAGLPGDEISGFALADAALEVNLVVAPSARGERIGHDLATEVLDAFPDADISAWSHGNHPAAAALAKSLGFDRVRDLWVMRRSLVEPLPDVVAPAASVVRTFEPGRDEEAFLTVNAAAFAHHPEQGRMTRADLEQRMLGFHWTKVHAGDPSYGEVYVVGVSPDAQGMGLGKVLTLTGLHHLRSLGLGEVILYVESDNAAAVAVYEGLGFTHADADTDVMYRRATPRP